MPRAKQKPRSQTYSAVKSLTNHPDFKITWNNRRRVINLALMFCVAVIVVIILMCAVGIGIDRDIQPNITSVLITLITSAVFFGMAVIGSYIFGASWDSNNFRSKITDLATAMVQASGSDEPDDDLPPLDLNTTAKAPRQPK